MAEVDQQPTTYFVPKRCVVCGELPRFGSMITVNLHHECKTQLDQNIVKPLRNRVVSEWSLNNIDAVLYLTLGQPIMATVDIDWNKVQHRLSWHYLKKLADDKEAKHKGQLVYGYLQTVLTSCFGIPTSVIDDKADMAKKVMKILGITDFTEVQTYLKTNTGTYTTNKNLQIMATYGFIPFLLFSNTHSPEEQTDMVEKWFKKPTLNRSQPRISNAKREALLNHVIRTNNQTNVNN